MISEPGVASTTPALIRTLKEVQTMTDRSCAIDGCDKPSVARRLCSPHYKSEARAGRLNQWAIVRPTGRRPQVKKRCIVDGCSNWANGRMCPKHFHWQQQRGTTEAPPATPAKQWQQGNGYLMISAAGHILARRGRVYVHRLTLFDKIGYGPHSCRWCGVHVNWFGGLVVDHIDEVRTNNNPTNLATSCQPCNIRRSAANRRPKQVA